MRKKGEGVGDGGGGGGHFLQPSQEVKLSMSLCDGHSMRFSVTFEFPEGFMQTMLIGDLGSYATSTNPRFLRLLVSSPSRAAWST
jgi:hypothetical protein